MVIPLIFYLHYVQFSHTGRSRLYRYLILGGSGLYRYLIFLTRGGLDYRYLILGGLVAIGGNKALLCLSLGDKSLSTLSPLVIETSR